MPACYDRDHPLFANDWPTLRGGRHFLNSQQSFVFLTIDLNCKLIIGLQKIINILQSLNKPLKKPNSLN